VRHRLPGRRPRAAEAGRFGLRAAGVHSTSSRSTVRGHDSGGVFLVFELGLCICKFDVLPEPIQCNLHEMGRLSRCWLQQVAQQPRIIVATAGVALSATVNPQKGPVPPSQRLLSRGRLRCIDRRREPAV
jgi:hypothetical protein